MTSKIVLSGGVRWDPEFVATDYFNRGSVFNYNAFLNNQFSTVYPNAPAGSFFYGDKGVPKAFTQNSPWQFSPRIGGNLRSQGKRQAGDPCGAAIVYDEPNLFTGQRNQQNPPFALTVNNTPVGAPMSFDSPWSNGTVTSNPFPLPQIPTFDCGLPEGIAIHCAAHQISLALHDAMDGEHSARVRPRLASRGRLRGKRNGIWPLWLADESGCLHPGNLRIGSLFHDRNYAVRFALTRAMPRRVRCMLAAGPARCMSWLERMPVITAWWPAFSIACRRASSSWPTTPGRTASTSPTMPRMSAPSRFRIHPTSREINRVADSTLETSSIPPL